MAMRDLIERLKAADGPSRELDAEIHCRLTGRIMHRSLPRGFTMTDYGSERQNRTAARAPYIHRKRGPAPRYTGSLDAAMSLVPKICDVRRFSDDPSGTVWELGEFKDGEITWLGESVTAGQPAHGLTIAALEALAAMQGEDAA